jgi:hypothetical protein
MANVVIRQHGPGQNVTASGTEGPPANQKGRPQGQQEMYGTGMRSDSEGEHTPGNERSNGQEQCHGHAQVSMVVG